MARRSAPIAAALVLTLVGVIAPPGTRPVAAARLPQDFTDNLVATVAAPTDFAFIPSGSIYITTQTGQVCRSSSVTGELLDIDLKTARNLNPNLDEPDPDELLFFGIDPEARGSRPRIPPSMGASSCDHSPGPDRWRQARL